MAHLQYIKHENRNYFLITIGMHRLDLFIYFFFWFICEYCIIAGSHMPGVHTVTASVLLFLTEFSKHIWSEDKRGRWDGAKRQRGEWGANGEGCEQAEDEDLRPFIITVPHEGR